MMESWKKTSCHVNTAHLINIQFCMSRNSVRHNDIHNDINYDEDALRFGNEILNLNLIWVEIQK